MIDAVIREIQEETGLTAIVAGFDGWHEAAPPPNFGQPSITFRIAVHYGTVDAVKPLPGHDAADARFVPIIAIGSYQLTPGAETVISRCAAHMGLDKPSEPRLGTYSTTNKGSR